MFFRIIGFFIFAIIGIMVWNILKLVFQLGRTSGELNRKYEEMQRNRSGRGSSKKDKTIELNRDQYKVE